ncbi:hypothetical protein C0580_01945 [Candidatus Parcubacteria bacterium]|nr:MAG: hypothetical protein C0580_01945 [Candidatus Parcubacteria bacterium]
MALEWKKIYSVNVKEIDGQHQKIFDLMNKLKRLEENEIQSDTVINVVNELEDYSIYHFNTEEKHFDKTKYPETEFHVKQHEKYKKKLSELKKEVAEKSDKETVDKVFNFLRDWWINHIVKVDMEYSEFFNKHGIY